MQSLVDFWFRGVCGMICIRKYRVRNANNGQDAYGADIQFLFFYNLVQLFHIGWEVWFVFALLSIVVYWYYSFQTRFVLVIAVVLMGMFVVQENPLCICHKTSEGCAL